MRRVGEFGYVRVRLVGKFGSRLVVLFVFVVGCSFWFFISWAYLFVSVSCSGRS